MNSISDYFEKIFVINLDRRREKIEPFLSQFDGLTEFDRKKIERFAAIDGTLPENKPPREWKVTPGAWGCLQSHHAIIKRGITEGWKNVLIFEDDATITKPDTFERDLNQCLDELPSDWEQFYLGCEHLNQPTDIPTIVSPHIHRTANGNRTHAYALTSEGMKKVDELFSNWKTWKSGWHCDWALGFVLHRTGKIRVYNARPHLFYQKEGMSDTMNKLERNRKFMNYKENGYCVGPFMITDAQVGYGKFSCDGKSGYEHRSFRCNGKKTATPLSAHAPSRIVVNVSTLVNVRAVIDDAGHAWVPITATVDGKLLGTVQTTGDKTPEILLRRGEHVLELTTDDGRSAMTGWDWWLSDDPAIEIISNCVCPNHCPGCNQAEFMAAEPDYEYTSEDAEALVACLEKYDVYRRVCFTGGEPAFWSKAKDVMKVFNDSKRITGNWVVTSRPEEEYITDLKKSFGKIFLSKRNDTEKLIESRPVWLDGVTVWDQRLHALPNSTNSVKSVNCCCMGQGIVAAVIGQTVYPCVMARSLQLAGRWPELVGVPLDEYFQSGLQQPIGTVNACYTCVNNLYFREKAKKERT